MRVLILTVRGTAILIILAATSVCLADPLPAPTGLLPGDGAQVTLAQILTGRVRLDWTDVNGADEYEVQVHGRPPFNDIYVRSSISEVLFPPTSIPGDYWWRVRAFDSIGAAGIYSASQTIVVTGRVDPTPLPTPSPTATPTPNPDNLYDMDLNGAIEAADLLLLLRYIRENDLRGDFNEDLQVGAKDLFLMAQRWGAILE